MLDTIAPFVRAGWSIHWLHPRTKRPIGDEWQNAPVRTLDALQATYSAGNNVGVRLGEPSKVEGGYLHVIDVDIRNAELAEEANARLRELFPEIDSFPSVISGSGGASRHYYFITDKPFHGRKLAVSDGKHRKSDGKWSYDYEVDLFGTGRQVVIPPSIHPDTGKPYIWEREFDFDMLDFGIGPFVSSAHIDALGIADTTTYEYETREPLTFEPGQLERDLDVLPIDLIDDRDRWVMLGQALHHQFGGDIEGFSLWMKYSAKSSKFLVGSSEKAELRRYRGFGRNRRKPVTMATVRQWAQEARTASRIAELDDLDDTDEFDDLDDLDDLDDTDEFDDLLGGSEADDFDAADAAAPKDDALEWKSLLEFNEDGAIKSTLHNLRLLVENDPRTAGVMQFNEFTQEIVQRGTPGVKPSRRKNPAKPVLQLDSASWNLVDPVNGDFWTEDKDNAIRAIFEAPKTQGGYSFKCSDRDLRAAIDIAARKHKFHPVREYLSALKWDGKPRVEQLFIDYLGTPDNAYTRNAARLTLTAGVTRIFEPGHKFDYAVILQGLQGKRKSTFIEVLAKSWFAELEGDFEDARQMVEAMSGAWCLEMPELGGFVRADVRHIKAFISRTKDKVRLAYAKRAQVYRRSSILWGSTNDDKYLKDETGNRRFLPILVEADSIDTDRLKRNVDQLWAEAVQIYHDMRAAQPHGTLPLYLSDEDAQVIAARLQESARIESADDATAGRIAAWLDTPVVSGDIDDDGDGQVRSETCLIQIWCEALRRDEAHYNQQNAQMLGRAMSQLRDWRTPGTIHTFKPYGRQRVYQRTYIPLKNHKS